MSASLLRIPVGESPVGIPVPTDVAKQVRNLMERLGRSKKSFRFASKAEFYAFARNRKIPVGLSEMFQSEVADGQDLWQFLTSPTGPTELITARMMASSRFKRELRASV